MTEYEFPEDKLAMIMRELIIPSCSFSKIQDQIDDEEIQELCDAYLEMYPSKDGWIPISQEHILAFNQKMFDKDLRELIKDGMVDVMWSEEDQEFKFTISEEGKKAFGDE